MRRLALIDSARVPPLSRAIRTARNTSWTDLSNYSGCTYRNILKAATLKRLRSQILHRSSPRRLQSLCRKGRSKQSCSPCGTNIPACPLTKTTMPALSNPSNDTFFAGKSTLDHPAHELSVDGASNEVEGTRLKSPVNVHKALPPVPPPDSSVFKTAQSASTTTPSFAHSQATTTRPSTASSFSSGRSRSSSKTDFRILTRGLVNPDMAGRNLTLTPVEPDMYLHPTKYDPGNPPKSPKT